MKNIISVVFLLGTFLSAQSQFVNVSRIDTTTIVVGDSLIVRNYNGTHEVLCGYGFEYNGAVPFGFEPRRSLFMIRDLSTGNVTLIDTLPAGYYVNDVQFVSLYNSSLQRDVVFCVFCGNRSIVTGGYWGISMDENAPWIEIRDETGFVGFFTMDAALNPSPQDKTYIRRIEDTKYLTKMAAYAETAGEYWGTCGYVYLHNAVLDIVGVPMDTLGKPSSISRVKFYPSCNGAIRWNNNIRLPDDNNEVVVDIIGTGDSIISVSKLKNSDNKLWIRKNRKENYHHQGGLQFNDSVFQFNIYNILCPLVTPTLPNSTYYKGNPRLCPLQKGSWALTFVAASQDGIYDGVFTIRMRQEGTLKLNGAYDKHSCELIDVSSYPESHTSISLTRESDALFEVHTIEWNLNGWGYYPMYKLNGIGKNVHSIDAYLNSDNEEYLHMGGNGSGLGNIKHWFFMDHCFFESVIMNDSFSNEILYLPPVYPMYTIYSNRKFRKYWSYPNDVYTYPVTEVPMMNRSVLIKKICSK